MPKGIYKRTEITKKRISLHHTDVSGSKNPRWTGGRIYNEAGYVFIYKPDHPYCNNYGYVREHRLVMEEKLVRYLLP